MLRRKRTLVIAGVIILVPVVAIAWWLLSPLLVNQTVEEEFPFAFNATVPPDMDRASVEKIMSGMASIDTQVDEVMPDAKPAGMPPMDDATSKAFTGAIVEAMTNAVMDTIPKDMPEATKQAVLKAIPEAIGDALPKAIKNALKNTATGNEAAESGTSQSEPVKLKSGEFHDQDRFHKGSGKAGVYRLPDGSYLLRLEDFKVTNGPDLRVILTPGANPEGPGDVTAPGHVELAKLKGNIGNQNYVVPADADISSFQSVVIYCKPFRVIFSVAPLADVAS